MLASLQLQICWIRQQQKATPGKHLKHCKILATASDDDDDAAAAAAAAATKHNAIHSNS